MQSIIYVDKAKKTYGDLTLFEDFVFSVEPNDKIGIIGENGAGKSTFLKILSEMEELDSGEIFKQKEVNISYVPQVQKFDESLSLIEWLFTKASYKEESEHVINIITQLRYFGFNDENEKIGNLSGGRQKRLLLCSSFLEKSELILFDEPTNHLDLEGILVFERLLNRASFAWVMVTHDRRLLEDSSKKVIEINNKYPGSSFRVNNGGYRNFLRRKEEFLLELESKKASLSNKLREEDKWLSRFPKARGTKSKNRIEKAELLREELSKTNVSLKEKNINIDVQFSERKTKRLIELKDVSFRYEEEDVLKNINFTLTRKERVGLLGLNGSGKSTLLKLLNSDLDPSVGEIERAQKLEVIYFSQERKELDENKTLKEFVVEGGDIVVYKGEGVHIASWLSRFGFSSSCLNAVISTLSGGERARLLIAKLMLKECDLLLLDEPTNDLDIKTIEALESSLVDFRGAFMLVSHDRYFLEKVCSSFYGLEKDGSIIPYISYKEWERNIKASKKEKSASVTKNNRAKKTLVKRTYKEQKEYEGIEDKLLSSEKEVELLEEELKKEEHQTDAKKLVELCEKLKKAKSKVTTLYNRWEELEKKS